MKLNSTEFSLFSCWKNVQTGNKKRWKNVQNKTKTLWKSGKCGILISKEASKSKVKEVKADVRETHRAGNSGFFEK